MEIKAAGVEKLVCVCVGGGVSTFSIMNTTGFENTSIHTLEN